MKKNISMGKKERKNTEEETLVQFIYFSVTYPPQCRTDNSNVRGSDACGDARDCVTEH